jgi:hypothetical protein
MDAAMSTASTLAENNPERVRQLLLCLDGLRYSGAIFLACHTRLSEKLRSFERLLQFWVPTSEVVKVVADIWSMVDAVHRIRLLIQRTPLLPKRTPDVRTFLDATAQVEVLRHYVQHINNEIGSLPASSPPLWGALSWVSSTEPRRCFTLTTSSKHLAQSAHGLVFDTHTGTFVRRIEFTAGTTTIDVDELFQRVQGINTAIRGWANSIRFANGTAYNYDPPVTPLICADFARAEICKQDTGRS